MYFFKCVRSLSNPYPLSESLTDWCPWQTEDVHSRLQLHAHANPHWPPHPYSVTRSGWKHPAATHLSSEICLFLYLFISISPSLYTFKEIKSATLELHLRQAVFVHVLCINASGCPPDLCQSVTAGIWHNSTSTSLSLRLRPLPSWLCTREAS